MTKRMPTIEDRMNQERFNGGDYCAERNLVCYASNRTGGVVLYDLNDNTRTLISARAAGAAKFSEDGKYLMYLAVAESGGRQLHCRDLDSGETRQITRFAGPIIDPIWSPDGSKVLFASICSLGLNKPKNRRDEAIIIEDFGYKSDGRGFIRPDEHMHLYVADVASGEVVALTKGTDDFMQHNWAPDSRHVACISMCNRSKSESLGFDLFILDINQPDSKPQQISRDVRIVSYPNPTRPVFSPDGAYIYIGVMEPGADPRNGYPEIYLTRFKSDGTEMQQIFQQDENCYQCVQFPYNAGSGTGFDKVQISADGRMLYFVSGWQGQCNIYSLDLEGDGHARLLAGGKQVYHGLSRVRQGKMLVTRAEPHLPESYWLMDVQTGELLQKVTQSAQDLLDDVALSQAEDFFFETADGQAYVHGWAMPPQNRENGKKYPTILYVHGGPHPFYTYGFTMEHQCLAAQGFGVIFCNPRGSSGYGMAHQDLHKAYDGTAFQDCLQFVDEAAKRFDWIDGDRVGVTGGSYGGYMTNYIATHSDRFRAYVTQRSVSNELIMYASSDMQGTSRDYETFEEFMLAELRRSTVCYAERICRPFLILHGCDDYRTPVEGAHQLYVALKDMYPDLPVKMVLFPHVGHDQPSDPRQLKVYFTEMVNWFKSYL